MSLPEEVIFDYRDFLDRTTVLYGGSGSGKSFMTVDIMYHLRPHIPQVIVVSPTDPVNRTYSNGLVRTPLIHYTLTEGLLLKIWERQEALSAVYARANEFATLQKLFVRLNIPHVNSMVEKVHSCKADNVAKVQEQFADNKQVCAKKITEIEEKFKEFITLIYKHFIGKHARELRAMNLAPDERHALKYLHFNPRMLIVFDDCSADFKTIKSARGKAVLGKMFYQNRHVFLTIIMGIHDDKLIDSELRKNSYMNVFTTHQSAHAYFCKASNAFPLEVRKQIDAWTQAGLWKANDKCQKLIYNRQKDQFFRYTAKKHPAFSFGSQSVHEFCDKVEAQGVNIDPNNAYLSLFT